MAWNNLARSPAPDTIRNLWLKALQYADGLTPYEQLKLRDALIFTDTVGHGTMFDRAVRLYQDYIRLYPMEGRALQSLAWYLRHVDRWAEAEAAARRGLQAGNTGPGLYDELVRAQIAVGKFAAADSAARAWRELHGPTRLWYVDAFRLATARGDHATGDSLLAEAADSLGAAAPHVLGIYTLAMRGRMREAEELFRLQRRNREVAAQASASLSLTAWYAALHANVTGDTAGGLAMLHNALAPHPLDDLPVGFPWTGVALHLASLGDTARARQLEAVPPANAPIYRSEIFLRGLLDLAAGRHHDAIRELRQVRYTTGHLPPLGSAYEAIGARDSAIAVYERFLNGAGVDYPQWHGIYLARVLERVAELYAARGDSTRAVQRYRTLADLWRDADPELQWRARRARTRALQLTAGGQSRR